MAKAEELEDLDDLLDRMDEVARDKSDKVTFGDLVEITGRRSYGPLLALIGLVALTPIGVIPGTQVVIAAIVILTAGQLLVGRERFWLPKPLLRLSVKADKLEKAVKFMRRPARGIDWILRPRLSALTEGLGARAVALATVLMALIMPLLEFVPFAVILPASALTAFGLGLVARDGLVTLVAFAVCLGAFVLLALRFF